MNLRTDSALIYICFILGKYRAVGRVIRAKHLKERLVIRDSAFKETETKGAANPIKLLEIIADTLYIKVTESLNMLSNTISTEYSGTPI